MKLPAACRNPALWWTAVAVWFAVLWLLSSGHPMPKSDIHIPFFDKVCHFGYFFGGGGLCAAAWYCRRPDRPAWGRILLVVAVTGALVGWLDEWHQTFTPGRSGNDPWDWLADVLGASTGALVFRWLRCLFDENPQIPETRA